MGQYTDILKKCAKDWACPDLMESVNKTGGRKIPFSSPSLNWATYGGVPRAALSEFYGVPNGGKTTTAIDVCKNALELFNKEYTDDVAALQEKVSSGKKEYKIALADLQERGPKKVLYVDLEHSFDKKWAATLGISNKDIDIMQPPNVPAEQILQAVEDIITTGQVGLIVLDSIPSLVTAKELEKKYGEVTMAPIAKLMTDFCRKIIQILMRYDCTMIFINQLRANLINPFVDNTPGGEAIKFYSSLRLSFTIGKPLDILGNELAVKAENPDGYLIEVRLKKQKSAPFDRKLAKYYLMAQSGLRVDFEFANLALSKYNIIQKNKAWYTICDPDTREALEDADGNIIKCNGMAKVYDYLQANPEYYQKMCDFIVADINSNGMDAVTSSAEPANDYGLE